MAGDASSMKSLVAYEKIRDMILAGAKLPGSRLVLTDLEAELGIGRGPIREALMRLDRSGLVKNVPYKGALVASPPTREEILIIFEMRIQLETRLMVEAMDHFTPEQLSELAHLHTRMADMDKNFYTLDRRFHTVIYTTANMPHISAIVDKLVESVEAFLTLHRQETSDREQYVNEHAQILEAIKNGDRELAQKSMKKNILSGLEVVERTFSRFLPD